MYSGSDVYRFSQRGKGRFIPIFDISPSLTYNSVENSKKAGGGKTHVKPPIYVNVYYNSFDLWLPVSPFLFTIWNKAAFHLHFQKSYAKISAKKCF